MISDLCSGFFFCERLSAISDLCSGMGGLSHGATACGFQTSVAVDMNSRFFDLYGKHAGAKCFEGDVTDPQVWYDV